MKHDDATPLVLDRLLTALDPDRERAGQRYVVLRRKLASFFDWRGAPFPDDCADRVLNIAARRLDEGEVVRDLSAYCAGIARMVLCEQQREQERERLALEQMPVGAPASGSDDADDRASLFDQCLNALPTDSRELILAYYHGEGRARIEARQALAERMGIPLNALRIRAWRIRNQLEEAFRSVAGSQAGKRK